MYDCGILLLSSIPNEPILRGKIVMRDRRDFDRLGASVRKVGTTGILYVVYRTHGGQGDILEHTPDKLSESSF